MAFFGDRVVFSSCLCLLPIFLLYMILLSIILCYYVASNKRKETDMNEDEDKPTPADGQLIWILWAFIVLMLGLLTLRSCL
jgi:heme/copper-type cytochrome/quinol oxidase subunit 2